MNVRLQIDIVDHLQKDNRRITVVGDDFQSIYGFRGSQPDVFQKFISNFYHKDLEQPLQYNYRCCPCCTQSMND